MSLFCLDCCKLVKVVKKEGAKCPKCGSPVVDIVKFSPEGKSDKKEEKETN